MSIAECLDFNNYNRYSTETNPTTNADMQDYMSNQNNIMKALCGLIWQPNATYATNKIVLSDSMPVGTVAVVTTAGNTGKEEPTWPEAGNTVVDGDVTYTMYSLPTHIETSGTGNVITDVTITDGALTLTKGDVPTADTKNTAGTTNTTSKIYLAGATTQEDNPQTYSNVNCYASGGYLYSGGSKVLTSVGTVVAAKGSATQPVYISGANTATACTMASGTGTAGVARIIAQALVNATPAATTSRSGYFQLGNLQIAYGHYTGANSSATVTFPKSFTNVACVLCSHDAGSTSDSDTGGFGSTHAVSNVTKTGFRLSIDSASGHGVAWLAVGYV